MFYNTFRWAGFDSQPIYRGVAKFGIALGSGPRGPGFKSPHSDHDSKTGDGSVEPSPVLAKSLGGGDDFVKINGLRNMSVHACLYRFLNVAA